MKNMFKRLTAAALLLCMLLAVIVPATAEAATSTTSSKRYNIMLVIDGSGSLTSQTAGYTDPKGMRYELISSLMSILEVDGHNIGAIVFSGTQKKTASDADMEEGIMLNTGMMSIDKPAPDGRTVKDYLENEVRDVYVDLSRNGCTDIGTALKVAEEQLQQMQSKNGLPSIVFLFTDGNTAFYGNPPEVVTKSLENRDNATLSMSQSGIRLFGAFLNNGGRLDDSEMKRLVCAANGISTTSPEFAYSYVEVQDADSIHGLTVSFLKFLGKIPPDQEPQLKLDNHHDEFLIPGLGVEEMNISLYSPYGDDLPNLTMKITQPDGTVVDAVPINKSRTFQVYKIVDPDPGKWMIDIIVPAGNQFYYAYTPVISLDIDAELQANHPVQDICVNKPTDFTCLLAQSGSVVTNPAAYMGYDCQLQIKNVGTGEIVSYDVQANSNGSLVYGITPDTYGTFEATTIFTCGSIVVVSDPMVLDLTNRAPLAMSFPKQKLTCGLFQPKTTDLDLSQYFSDPEDGTNLTYFVSGGNCNANAVTINGSTMTMRNKDVGTGTITISAMDTQGASTPKDILVSVSNVTIWYILALIILLIIIAIIVIRSIQRKNNNRPDGELSVSFDMMHEDRACQISLNLDVPGVEAKSKTNLYELLKNALRNDDAKIQSGIYARDVMTFLTPLSNELSGIVVFATVKKKGKKTMGAIGVKHNKKNTVLFDSFADFFLSDASFTLEFKAAEKDNPDPFADDPFQPTNSKKSDNFFDNQDDFFQAPPMDAPRKPSRPAKKEEPISSGTGSTGNDNDFDFF